jgi:hypothetical protein
MTEMITVCCKLPNGLILELDELRREVPATGGKEVAVWRGTGRKVQICGSNANHPDSPNPGRVVGGYGLTEVPLDFWDAWAAQHKGNPLLLNALLFAQPTSDRATSKAKDQAKVVTGFEPMDPDRPAPGVTRADFSRP